MSTFNLYLIQFLFFLLKGALCEDSLEQHHQTPLNGYLGDQFSSFNEVSLISSCHVTANSDIRISDDRSTKLSTEILANQALNHHHRFESTDQRSDVYHHHHYHQRFDINYLL